MPTMRPEMKDVKLCWIGLGNMGRGMVTNIAQKTRMTNPISIFDIVSSRAQALASTLGSDRVTVARSTPEAAADVDIIFYSVPDDKVAEAVLDEILTVEVRGRIIVNTSTVHPDTTRREAAKVVDRGGFFVACPVFGSAAMSEAGQLIAVPAGENEAVTRILPFCQGVMSRAVINLSGEDAAKATLLKLIGNTFVLNMVGALSEGHVLAEKSGLGSVLLHKFIQTLFPGPYTGYSERIVNGDYYRREEPLGLVTLAKKDAGHARRIASEFGMTLNMVEVVESYLDQVLKLRGQNAEFIAVYGAKRTESGLLFENQ